MKNLFNKAWFLGTLILGVNLIIFLINLWIMSLKLKVPYEVDNLWSLSFNVSSGDSANNFALIFMILFFISILPLLLSVYSFFKKHTWGYMASFVSFLGFSVGLIVFQSYESVFTIFTMILIIFNILLTISTFVFLIFRNKVLDKSKNLKTNPNEKSLSNTKFPLNILFIDAAAILVFLTTFLIPLYSLLESGDTYHASLVRVLFSGDTNLITIIYFIVNFSIFLSIFLYMANALSIYFYDKEKFIQKSKSLITFVFITTILFFLTGLTIDIYYNYTLGDVSSTIAFIPLILMAVIYIIYSIIKGKYSAYNQETYKESTLKYPRVEPLLYIVLLTAVTVLMLFLPIIKITVTAGTYEDFVNLTGFNILRDYASLDPSYSLGAFLLVAMLISIGLCFVITLASYLSKDSHFKSIVKLTTIVNIFFVFIIGVSGYYFQIANEINQIAIVDIFNYYQVDIPDTLIFDYIIGTDAIYALLVSLGILIVMFIRKSFENENLLASDASGLAVGDTQTNSNQITEDEIVFDPCPSFSEIDSKIDQYAQDLKLRKVSKVKETSLNELIHFIVSYAKNSRLHLSYTPQDIATFVAGLGASKLSILQGMSGTGKTSLPKIFSEAILGNCEIIEVESSWKDKNELLGYYNEFSMKYTPKKFTLALYKAALNPDIFTFILLDEMNLSRIEYYFSDFLSLMENEENQREIKLININLHKKDEDNQDYLALEHGHTLKVAPNIWFIGTANRDESTFVISDKVYDRAHTINFTKRAPKVRNFSSPLMPKYYDYQTINKLFEDAKKTGDFDAENNEIIKQVEVLLAPYNISFGNRILKQIEDFVNLYKACFPEEDVENEAIEKILLSKVVAKLELKTIDDIEKLIFDFEALHLDLCASFIKQLDNE
ncbi:MAG: hypothetical protein K8Q99_04945 [Acholeplasmataceae bacterium]|nr:hypothetical protein [Acholeplasmataceae bacterium]